MNAAAQQPVRARKPAAAKKVIEIGAAPLLNLGPYPFPKYSDFVSEWLCDWKPHVAGNATGVALSWQRAEVRAARVTKHSVRVTYNGETSDHKSVAAAFRALRLDFSKHIRFRLSLKSSGKKAFTSAAGEVYMFTLVEASEE